MPVSPDMAEALAKELLATYAAAESDMLRVVARRVAAGIDEPGWAEAKLAETQRLRRELQRIVAQLGQLTPAQVEAAIAKAYGIGQAAGAADLEATGRISTAFGATGEGVAIRTLTLEAVGTLSEVGLRALRAAEDIYQAVVDEATRSVLVGTQTRRQAAQRALDAFAHRGITGFVDAAGRNWEMSTYTEMAVRTTSGRAAIAGHADKLADAGLDLVMVSDSPEECEMCRPWEGAVLSLRGRTPGYTTLSEAEGAGLFHPNCTHSVGLYDPRFTLPLTRTANPAGYAQRQQQRYLERQIRTWKRREATAIDPAASRRAKAKVREWQSTLRSFVAENDRKRLRYRESVTGAR